MQLVVELPLTKSDFCERLDYHTVMGASECPPLNETLAQEVGKDIFDENFSRFHAEAKLMELTLLFQHGMVYDRGQTGIVYCVFKMSKGIDDTLLVTCDKKWTMFY
jgi:hypothetical protein